MASGIAVIPMRYGNPGGAVSPKFGWIGLPLNAFRLAGGEVFEEGASVKDLTFT